MLRKNQLVAPPPAPVAPPASGAPQAGRWAQSVHSDVKVPLLRAMVTGIGIATAGAAVAGGMIMLEHAELMPILPPLAYGWLSASIVITVVAWFPYERQVRETWWRREARDQIDYDGDGQIGRPDADAIIVRDWRDNLVRRSAEELTQQRFEEFIAKLYLAGATDTETIRRLGFKEPERAKFIKKLREAQLITPEHSGKSAAWRFVPVTADDCVRLARQRIIWRVPSSSSLSSPIK